MISSGLDFSSPVGDEDSSTNSVLTGCGVLAERVDRVRCASSSEESSDKPRFLRVLTEAVSDSRRGLLKYVEVGAEADAVRGAVGIPVKAADLILSSALLFFNGGCRVATGGGRVNFGANSKKRLCVALIFCTSRNR